MTYILAATHDTALKLAQAIASGKLPPMADNLDAALALRELHPRPLRYGLGVWYCPDLSGRSRPLSVDLARPSELSQLTAKALAGPADWDEGYDIG